MIFPETVEDGVTLNDESPQIVTGMLLIEGRGLTTILYGIEDPVHPELF